MGRVFTAGKYRGWVYAERGGRHKSRHAHIDWPEGEAVYNLDTGILLAGTENREVRRLFERYRDALSAAWDNLNADGE